MAERIKPEINEIIIEEIEFIRNLKIDIVKDALPVILLKSIARDRGISKKDFVNILLAIYIGLVVDGNLT